MKDKFRKGKFWDEELKGLMDRLLLNQFRWVESFKPTRVIEFSLFSYFVTSLKIELCYSPKHVEQKGKEQVC